MLKPKYLLTNKILNNLREIERFYGNLEAKQIPKSLLLNLEKNNLIQSSYASNSIEGNPLSKIEVTNLLLNERVPVNRDEKEIVNYYSILKNLNTYVGKKLSLDSIISIHSKLMSGVNDKIKGQIRNNKVVVGMRLPNGKLIIKHDPPFHKKTKIKKAVQKLTDWLDLSQEQPILKAGIFHHEFVYIHPFSDGNGRTCRLLTALIFLKYQYQINKYFVLDDYYDIDRELYSTSLNKADKGDKTSWLEYFTDGVKYSLQSALGKIESGLSHLQFELRPTAREQEVLNLIQKYQHLTSNNLVNEIKISRQQAHKLLKSLVEKGLLKKQGSTKNSYYKLN
ncbi:hypothetical protein A2954_06235 [Candidatus Roizmanbacteria bacterium RIFCSPLOWO2_01_FULL_37_12]|uniref:Fido domain-containing protein n=1 Tax=Candidatus Roizmanbacteria bacterium RIFCSPLOWO2_01_FULL_37_12 TaxID=1802056 RepID=A0A1F7IGV3_9BACT|nr:MAG: hypothetical protein A3D76_01505 [Candidatus Roizmanbacteria bacterium RIFCSPHIGHO2_02_FULL_37_9b]OGK42598.1 MAG: hypothetical protein A2954_06235 [Candidatus Roizmanbacteria bacterium RIFCSPLOWO2_01_FULL_37_12]